jgi:hypothetical protein
MLIVNWCGHGQEFVPWPEEEAYWVLVPVVETIATYPGRSSKAHTPETSSPIAWAIDSRLAHRGTFA